MAKSRLCDDTLNLLEWQPAPPVVPSAEDVAPPRQPDGRDLADRITLAVAAALRDCDLPREEVARRMSAFLGERVPVSALNAYAAQGKPDHNISFVRVIALCKAIGRADLLELGAAAIGAAVVDRRYVPAIRSAISRDQARELRAAADAADRVAEAADRQWKGR